MAFRRLRRSAGAAWLAGLAAAAAGAQETPVIRVDVNLVRVLATVKNAAGQPVGSLEKSDFEIADNGAAQEIAVFERHTEQPLSIALMIDASGSTAKDLKQEIESLQRFIKALLAEGNREDSAALYSFNWEVVRRNYFTRNLSTLERSLRSIRGEAGTSLYDAIYLAAEDLERRDGRKAMVIVTDGGDTTSSKKFHDALNAAQLADAVIYPVVVIPIANDAGRNTGGENALTFMAQATGGRTFLATLGEQLDRAFAEILRELRTQYLIGFYPRGVPPTSNPFHHLEVRVRRPDLRVLARNGYYGEVEGGPAAPGARVSVPPAAPAKQRQEKRYGTTK